MLAQSENAPAALDKIDALLAQASYISLERDSTKDIGPFYVLLYQISLSVSRKKSHLSLAN